jgi:hypothetical protein
MTFIQIPPAQLQQIGADLRSLSAELDGQHAGAQQCDGLDPTDHGRLLAAVDGFRTAWNASVRGLLDHITRNGDAATSIGRLTVDTDAQLAARLSPEAVR